MPVHQQQTYSAAAVSLPLRIYFGQQPEEGYSKLRVCELFVARDELIATCNFVKALFHE